MRVHKGKALIAGIAALALALTACSSSGGKGKNKPSGSTSSQGTSSGNGTKGTGNLASCGSSPNDCNTAKVKPGGTMTYVIEKTITGWNQLAADSNTFEFGEVLDGILPSVFNAGPDLKPFLNTDLMSSAQQTSASPQTLVYKIKPDAVWNDGTPVDVNDFKYQWVTNDPTQCPKCATAGVPGYNQIKSITGSDGGKTVTVVMKTPFFDWQSLFSTLYPAHIAAQHGGMATPAARAASFQWFDNLSSVPTYSAGPYVISNFVKDTSVTETPNPKWYGATKPSLSKLIFRIITDQTQEVPALQNNDVQAIYPQPSVDIVDAVKQLGGTVSSYLGKGLTWEHLDFNLKNPLLADKQLRLAIFTAIDRKSLIAHTIGQFVPGAQPLNNHMFVPGQPGYQDNVSASGQGSGNVSKAKSILTAAGYTGIGSTLKNKAGTPVSIRCSYTAGNTLRGQTCQLIQSELKALGITVKPTPIQSLGDTLSKGDFDLIIYAWVDTPFAVAGAQQTWVSTSGSDFGHNVDPTVDSLLNAAAAQTDPTVAQQNLNKADQALTNDVYVLPLFQKPTYLAVYSNIANIRDNATSVGPPYNDQAWGVRAS